MPSVLKIVYLNVNRTSASAKLFRRSDILDRMCAERHRNHILSAIPSQEWDSLAPHFEKIDLPLAHVLVPEGEAFRKVYFPLDCVISTVAIFESGASVEMSTVGREGMLPVLSLVGGNISPAQQVVQIAGSVVSIPYEVFCSIRRESVAFNLLLNAYAQAFLEKTLRSVACNAVHTVEERAARWLLLCHDQVGRDTFPLTQEFFAAFLGVARPTVTIVSRKLRRAGYIHYRRGCLSVVDREGLENASCECYAIVRRYYDEAFSKALAIINQSPISRSA